MEDTSRDAARNAALKECLKSEVGSVGYEALIRGQHS